MMRQVRGELKFFLVMLFIVWGGFLWGCGSSGTDTKNAKDTQDPLTVSTGSGKIKGIENDRARIFKGIPFAQPPVGNLRWKAPQDPLPWTDVLDAGQSREVCVQGEMTPTWQATGRVIGSEDCLYMDLYRPKNDAKNLPVYVFFHGGANRFGGAAGYDGSYLAEERNIIVAIAQYRLGPLGWFRNPSLRTGEAADDSGNYGTLDNIKALQWIKENITAFGGDPTKVTIGGQSAGASNVAKLLISPLAAGLFRGAVMQSIGGDIIPPEDGDALSAEMVTHLGYDPAVDGDLAAYLRGKTAEEITLNYSNNHAGFADGAVLPGRYVNVIYGGNYNKVPVMLGSTEYEFKNFLPLYGQSFGHPNWLYVHDLFDPDFDPNHEWTFDEIFPNQGEIDLYEAMGKYQSAGWKYKSVDELAELLKTRQEEGVYAYLFQWGNAGSASAEFAHAFGPAHSMDIPFFYGYDRDLFQYALTDENRPGFNALRDIMTTYLGNFVKNGDPGTAGGVRWEQWSNDPSEDAPKCIHLDADKTTALVAMDSSKLTPEALRAEAGETVAGWPDADAGLVLAMLDTFPAAPAEYLLNDEGYELLVSNLKLEPLEGTPSKVYPGIHAQAGYLIEIPDGWEAGTHDLVMYAHGYRGEGIQLTVTPPTRLRAYLNENGIAWAASSYTANGYNIVSGVESTAALLSYFKEQFGEPRRVYLVGHSMGGHVTARTVADSDYKGDYAGALPMCGVTGGAPDLFNYHMDWGLTASYFAGHNYPVPYTQSDLDLLLEDIFGGAGDGVGVLGTIPRVVSPYTPYSGTLAQLNEAGENFKNAIMYRSGGARPLFDRAFSLWADFMIHNAADRLLDPEAGLGLGNIAGNGSTEYDLDGDGAPDTTAEEELLNADITRVADPTGDFSALMWPVSGNIQIPVLSLHTIGDLYVPFSMEQLWAGRIIDAGNESLFRARAIRGLGHCTFTAEEETRAFADLMGWVEDGTIPGGDDILNPVAVAAEDFGCIYTSASPLRTMEDPDYDALCAQ